MKIMSFILILLSLYKNTYAQEKIKVEKINGIKTENIKFTTDSKNKIILMENIEGIKTYRDEIKNVEVRKDNFKYLFMIRNPELVKELKRVGGDGTGGGITLEKKLLNKINILGGDGTGGG